MKKWLFIGWLVCCMHHAVGQQSDSLRLLSYPEFYRLLISNHPVVKQAGLEVDYAAADLMQARGNFDPKLLASFDRKSLNGKDYYNRLITDVKVPIWNGIDAKIGQENNTGYFLNNQVTKGQLLYAGVELPLLRNLMMDERRRILDQSKIYQEMARAKQQLMVNKIVFAGAKAYWDWYFAFQQANFAAEGLQLAQNRFDYLRTRVRIGEVAGIDSVEAKITLQTRQVDYANALVNYQNETIFLSNYIWNADGSNQPLAFGVVPPPTPALQLTPEHLAQLKLQAQSSHPELLNFGFRQNQLAIERRFRQGQLLPRLDASAYLLRAPKLTPVDVPLLSSNHKIGLDFEFPVFLRKERGKLEQVKIQQLQVDLDRRLVSREILADIDMAYNEAANLGRLLVIQQEATQNQRLLVEAEQQRFRIGESSLFLINARETKLIEMQTKTEELKAKYQKALAQLQFSAGLSSINLR